MNEKREKLTAGIALLNAAAMMLEQAGVELGGHADNGTGVLLSEALHAAQMAAVRAVRVLDKTKEVA